MATLILDADGKAIFDAALLYLGLGDDVVPSPDAPVNTAPPQVTPDQTALGNTLTSTTGTWTGDDIVYTRQWFLEDVSISGATNETYVPTVVGTYRVLVTATNDDGSDSVYSNIAVVTRPGGGPSAGPIKPPKPKKRVEAKKKSDVVSRLAAQVVRPPIADPSADRAQQQAVTLIADQAATVSSRLMRQRIEQDDEAILLKILQ